MLPKVTYWGVQMGRAQKIFRAVQLRHSPLKGTKYTVLQVIFDYFRPSYFLSTKDNNCSSGSAHNSLKPTQKTDASPNKCSRCIGDSPRSIRL